MPIAGDLEVRFLVVYNVDIWEINFVTSLFKYDKVPKIKTNFL